eukprot:Amastigsp_a843973_9.p4 type:complete len:104 gc:universal Amastigsp_a843973_9:1359-1048(-)
MSHRSFRVSTKVPQCLRRLDSTRSRAFGTLHVVPNLAASASAAKLDTGVMIVFYEFTKCFRMCKRWSRATWRACTTSCCTLPRGRCHQLRQSWRLKRNASTKC